MIWWNSVGTHSGKASVSGHERRRRSAEVRWCSASLCPCHHQDCAGEAIVLKCIHALVCNEMYTSMALMLITIYQHMILWREVAQSTWWEVTAWRSSLKRLETRGKKRRRSKEKRPLMTRLGASREENWTLIVLDMSAWSGRKYTNDFCKLLFRRKVENKREDHEALLIYWTYGPSRDV